MKTLFVLFSIIVLTSNVQARDILSDVNNILPAGSSIDGQLNDGSPCTVHISTNKSDSFWGGHASLEVSVVPKLKSEDMAKVLFVENSPRFVLKDYSASNDQVVLVSTMKANDQYSGSTKTSLKLEKHKVQIKEKGLLFTKRNLTCSF